MSHGLHVGDRIIYVEANGARTTGGIIAPASPPASIIEPSRHSYPGVRSSDERFWKVELDNGTRFDVPESKLEKAK